MVLTVFDSKTHDYTHLDSTHNTIYTIPDESILDRRNSCGASEALVFASCMTPLSGDSMSIASRFPVIRTSISGDSTNCYNLVLVSVNEQDHHAL